jgi:hypothetical protein
MKKLFFTAIVILMFLIVATAWSDKETKYYNAITDVPGIEVGHYTDKKGLTEPPLFLPGMAPWEV